MKRYLLTIVLATLLGMVTFQSADAQESSSTEAVTDGTDTDEFSPLKEASYYTLGARHNWFISVSGGAQLYYGTEDFTYISTDNLAPMGDLSFGKWVAPSLGFRLQLSGGLGYGWSSTVSPYMLATPVNNLYREQFWYFNSHIDLLWDVLSMGNNYRYARLFHLIPFIGAGAVASYVAGVGHELSPAATAGFIMSFRLTDKIFLNLELRSTFADGRVDKVSSALDDAGAITSVAPKIEFMNAATIGVQFNLSPKKFERRYQIDADYRYQLHEYRRSVMSLQKQLLLSKEKVKELNEDVYKLIKENDELIKKQK